MLQDNKFPSIFIDSELPAYPTLPKVGTLPDHNKEPSVPAPTKFKQKERNPSARELGIGSALNVQVAGDHYKAQAIQPVEYIHANKIGYFEGNVIKYVSRWKQKGGLADLEKAKHYIELLIELEEEAGAKGNGNNPSNPA